jgi:hypothetical protein
MGKAFSGALSLALTILVLHLALPQIGDLLVQIIVKILTIANGTLDHGGSL